MWFLGIDIGTTHVKVVGVTADGTVLPAERRRTPVRLHGGLPFHHAEDVWRETADLVAQYASGTAAPHGALGGACVASFGQEESVAVDAAGREVHPSLAWWETGHGGALAPGVAEWFDSPEHYAVSGMRLRPNQTPARLAHLRAHDPDAWARTARWVDFGTYTMWRLTGRWAAASSQITHSQLFDLAGLVPDRPSMDALGVEPGLFPDVLPTGAPLGEITPGALGVRLAPGATVHVGGHDQVIAARAVAAALADAEGAGEAPNVFDSIGTSEYLMVTTGICRPGRRAYDLGVDHERSWLADGYVLGHPVPSGKIIQLLAELFFAGDFDALFGTLGGEARALPSLRMTVSAMDDTDQGLLSLDGIPAGATPADIARLCLDTIGDRVRGTVTALCELAGTRPRSVALMGSLFRRPEMVAHRRSRWDTPLRVSELAEPVATGAARIALERATDREGAR
ncbi:FGGY family carbohydrate kinase [Streptomyces sp. RFCAC02]|uniref:FGGY-family carbohydrate kinase n=1 Tax=Streptomyces sp. RFCAC02 TaxID=2499143 RepID=UPI00102094AC|nr:FGGY family carbohydrate kinase [Streptomyces sp. RFCAC02]